MATVIPICAPIAGTILVANEVRAEVCANCDIDVSLTRAHVEIVDGCSERVAYYCERCFVAYLDYHQIVVGEFNGQ